MNVESLVDNVRTYESKTNANDVERICPRMIEYAYRGDGKITRLA